MLSPELIESSLELAKAFANDASQSEAFAIAMFPPSDISSPNFDKLEQQLKTSMSNENIQSATINVVKTMLQNTNARKVGLSKLTAMELIPKDYSSLLDKLIQTSENMEKLTEIMLKAYFMKLEGKNKEDISVFLNKNAQIIKGEANKILRNKDLMVQILRTQADINTNSNPSEKPAAKLSLKRMVRDKLISLEKGRSLIRRMMSMAPDKASNVIFEELLSKLTKDMTP